MSFSDDATNSWLTCSQRNALQPCRGRCADVLMCSEQLLYLAKGYHQKDIQNLSGIPLHVYHVQTKASDHTSAMPLGQTEPSDTFAHSGGMKHQTLLHMTFIRVWSHKISR